MTDENFALFADGVVLVVKYARQGIPENRECFLERHSVLGDVGRRLPPVPFEYHIHCESGTLSRRPWLEPPPEVEEVVQAQLPAGEEIGDESLIAGEDCI